MAAPKNESNKRSTLRDQTVKDFGEQWTYYTENNGYYASDAFFADLIAPLMSPNDFKDAACAEIGAGTGNIAAMVLRAGAKCLTAVEPSDAIGPLRKNLSSFGDRAEVVCALGEQIAPRDLDIVISIGVLHHIPEPDPVVSAAYDALRPGGHIFIWLYGHEGNRTYLAIAQPLRAITKRLPIPVLDIIAYAFDAILIPGIWLARRGFNVPLANYLRNVYGKLSAKDRRIVIVDQLNPAWALYYTKDEAHDLLARAGFTDIELHHRHGYSWSVLGRKPVSQA